MTGYGIMSGMKGSGQTNASRSERLRFRRYRPGPRLSPSVRNYWTLQTAGDLGACRRQRVTPDGCIDILFVRRGPTEDFKALVVGTMTRPIFEELTGPVEYLGIRFAPGGFGQFFRTPACELTDRIVPLDSLATTGNLTTQLAGAPDLQTRLRILEDALSPRLLPTQQDPILTKVLESISACRGIVTVEQLARTTGWSPRHLRRVFRESVGVGPKLFCEIVRFKSAARSLRRRPRPPLLQAALEAGYYDQAHFIHDFQRFYGASPSGVFEDHDS